MAQRVKNKFIFDDGEELAFRHMNVCFSGVRDKLLIDGLKYLGAKASDSYTNKTNILVLKDINSTSSKAKKAKKDGIRIVQYDEFIKALGATKDLLVPSGEKGLMYKVFQDIVEECSATVRLYQITKRDKYGRPQKWNLIFKCTATGMGDAIRQANAKGIVCHNIDFCKSYPAKEDYMAAPDWKYDFDLDNLDLEGLYIEYFACPHSSSSINNSNLRNAEINLMRPKYIDFANCDLRGASIFWEDDMYEANFKNAIMDEYTSLERFCEYQSSWDMSGTIYENDGTFVSASDRNVYITYEDEDEDDKKIRYILKENSTLVDNINDANVAVVKDKNNLPAAVKQKKGIGVMDKDDVLMYYEIVDLDDYEIDDPEEDLKTSFRISILWAICGFLYPRLIPTDDYMAEHPEFQNLTLEKAEQLEKQGRVSVLGKGFWGRHCPLLVSHKTISFSFKELWDFIKDKGPEIKEEVISLEEDEIPMKILKAFDYSITESQVRNVLESMEQVVNIDDNDNILVSFDNEVRTKYSKEPITEHGAVRFWEQAACAYVYI